MARVELAVFDAGPLIHLNEINAIKLLRLFKRIFVSNEVRQEARGIKLPKNCAVLQLGGQSKDLAKLLSERYGIDLGEASAIALAKQEKVSLLFTDDLMARDAAKHAGLEPHGTLAIIARAFREGIFTKNEALALLEKLHSHSSLYLTVDLLNWARNQIESYN